MHLVGHLQGKTSGGGGSHNGGGDDMLRSLLQGAGQAQNLLGTFVRCCLNRNEPRTPNRQRTGLIEQHGVRLSERVERRAAFDDDAAAGGLRHPRNESDGRGKDKWAGRGDDQDGERADGVASKHPGKARHEKRHRQQQQGVAIR